MTVDQSKPVDAQPEVRVAELEQQVEQLYEALKTRQTIGLAIGLLMGQEGLTSEEAFDRLVSVSQNSNTKVRDIARHYVVSWDERVARRQGVAAR